MTLHERTTFTTKMHNSLKIINRTEMNSNSDMHK